MIQNEDDIPPPSYESIHPNVYTRTTEPIPIVSPSQPQSTAPTCNYTRINNPDARPSAMVLGLERQLKEMHWVVIILVISLVLLLLCSFLLIF